MLIDDLRRHASLPSPAGGRGAGGEGVFEQIDLFADFNGLPDGNVKTECYQHDARATFGVTPGAHSRIKGLDKVKTGNNLRDHMGADSHHTGQGQHHGIAHRKEAQGFTRIDPIANFPVSA
jgi:hypothetical protein